MVTCSPRIQLDECTKASDALKADLQHCASKLKKSETNSKQLKQEVDSLTERLGA